MKDTHDVYELKKKSRYMRRGIFLAAILTILSLVIVAKLFDLQILKSDYYLDKVLDNIQKETIIKAKRGVIYDRNGNTLATNITVYRVFISAADIEEDEDAKAIATALSDILGLEYKDIYEKTLVKTGSGSKDRTIMRNVRKAEADKIRLFISGKTASGNEKGYVSMVYLEEGTMRYYPGGTLASQVVGVMGTDAGLLGLELRYNSELSGTDGVYVTAKDALGNELPSEYEKYIEANDGYNVVSTIDSKIQGILDAQLELAYNTTKAGNRVCGVVMDVSDGSVLAMGSYPSFDLNSPFELCDEYTQLLASSGYTEESDEYKKLSSDLLYKMWSNKTITDTYYPGSTFKPVTTSMAFQENVINESTVFTCTGVFEVVGEFIHCAKRSGHGTHEFSYMLEQSCNPTMIQVSLKLGTDTFYKYFSSFGYTEKTGIDLPGEAQGIVFDEDKFSTIDLAVSSFGQGFTTTVIRQISSICTVANGGYLVSPHLVSRLTDSAGNTVVEYDYSSREQVVSSENTERVCAILADGVINGGAKNAYVAGYRVAAKTGTSEKIGYTNPITGESNLVVGSCVGFAPADDPKVAIIIMVDEPHPDDGNRYGSVVAAPYVANSLAQILPYIGVEPVYSESEMSAFNLTVGKYEGMTLDSAKLAITKEGAAYEVIGSGNYVVAQVPAADEIMRKSDGKIILYAGELVDGKVDNSNVEYKYSTVPDIVGDYTYKGVAQLKAAGFNIRITGATNYMSGTYASISSQSEYAGKSLPVGTIIEITSLHLSDIED